MRVRPILNWPLYLGLLVAGAFAALSVRYGAFVAGGPDACGYVSGGKLWSQQAIYRPQPLVLWAFWPNASEIASPLTYRSGPQSGTEVSIYPLGFPVLIASATSVLGAPGAYLVAPFMSAVLIWCAFSLARRIAGSVAGLIAAILLGASPEVILQSVHPMSDVPAAALWTAAWLLALNGTASAGVAAGCLTALAAMVRPNLAPLFVVIALTLVLARNLAQYPSKLGFWRPVAAFLLVAAVGPLLVMWAQAVLYGGPLTTGYPGWKGFFRLVYVPINVKLYPQLLTATHSVLPFAGLALLLPAVRRLGTRPTEAQIIAVTGAAMLLSNVALYLPYVPFAEWPFLRFLLPGLTALLVLFAGLIGCATRFVWSHLRWPALIVPLTTIIVLWQGAPQIRYSLNEWRTQKRILVMGHYLDEVLPANAAVLSFFHSCAIVHYTGRQVVRPDALQPALVDIVVDDLRQHGYRPVLIMDQQLEERMFREVFRASRFANLDWRPRAVFTDATSVLYLDFWDSDHRGQDWRWPIDKLR